MDSLTATSTCCLSLIVIIHRSHGKDCPHLQTNVNAFESVTTEPDSPKQLLHRQTLVRSSPWTTTDKLKDVSFQFLSNQTPLLARRSAFHRVHKDMEPTYASFKSARAKDRTQHFHRRWWLEGENDPRRNSPFVAHQLLCMLSLHSIGIFINHNQSPSPSLT